jgi:hypothetical protein
VTRTEKAKRRALLVRRNRLRTGEGRWTDEQRENMSAAQRERWRLKKQALGLDDAAISSVETDEHSTAGSADYDLDELPSGLELPVTP